MRGVGTQGECEMDFPVAVAVINPSFCYAKRKLSW